MLILCLIKPEYAEYIWSFVELSYAKNAFWCGISSS